jgi:serine/threonine-protein kinase
MPRQASASADPYRGKKIGKYEILTRLSVGGMAELFLAFTSGPVASGSSWRSSRSCRT